MTVYIGIPTVGLQKYLIQTIDSIKMDEDWKLLIVDNMSIDGTREWVIDSGHEYILNPENYGVTRSWNQIIFWAMGHDDFDIVFILNNDIVLHPDAFNYMLESARENGKDFVTGVNVGNDPKMLKYTTRPEPRYSPAVNFSCFGMTKPVITRVGLFDEGFKIAYYEDNDYHHRMQLEGADSVSDLWAPFTHYGSRTIKEGGVDHNQAFIANREYFREKWGFLP